MAQRPASSELRRLRIAALVTSLAFAGLATTTAAASSAAARPPHASISPNGPAVDLALQPGQTGTVSFMGLTGEAVSIATTATFAARCDAHVRVVDPTRATIAPARCAGAQTAIGPITLAADGTYAVHIVAGGSAEGSITVSVTSTGDTESITPDAARIPIQIDPATERLHVGFFAHAGEKFSALASRTSDIEVICSIGVEFVDASDHSLGGGMCPGPDSTDFLDAVSAPSDGVYYLSVFDADQGTSAVSFDIKLLRVTDLTEPVSSDGQSVPFTIRTPGQNANFTFAGTGGQRISVLVSQSTIDGGGFIDLVRPDGSQRTWTDMYRDGDSFLDATKLDVTGIWRVVIDPDAAGPWVGSAAFQLFTVPNLAPRIAPGGHENVDIATPGQNARLRFHGTAGDARTISVSDVSFPEDETGYLTIAVVRPDGTTLSAEETTLPADPLQVTLDQTGRFKILLDPASAATGTVRVDLS
jgi:hypothetical protein